MSADEETRRVLYLCIGDYRGRTLAGFFAYVQGRHAQYVENLLYRVYVTDALQKICENTANFAGGHIMQQRYYDAAYGKPKKEEDAEKIITKIIKAAGLEVRL